MPTYQYRCTSCGNELEVVQKMTDAPLTRCTKCEQETFERVISAEGGFVLKGSGFYGTDYCASKPSSSTPASAPGSCSTGTCPFAK
ncbi:FmdB family zinc ribbon protein [Chlorobium phaeobacteroides]|uniref:Putative regulatory protein, FmdB family n=1 Tax=Chlorobium phaeobacteroides (strain DSM 266 / SMG 266 / 2430) TaxID=290317 RepID=A1BJG6_CHLPD|nr:zinc ribbon domain-containing protein [Chlorobium phaeobacteroides]ABL66543.1 putative regulatory protein, FmdB family [Chlorobium phaeobacteroides DSM 266]MBV5319679.1 zinc ribbon domain-containing protein [Chlorobium phaeobacteroides]